MGHYDNIEAANEVAFKKYWNDRGVDVVTHIEETFSKKGRFPCLRSNLVMRIPKYFNGKIVGDRGLPSSEILPRQQRKYLLPERR